MTTHAEFLETRAFIKAIKDATTAEEVERLADRRFREGGTLAEIRAVRNRFNELKGLPRPEVRADEVRTSAAPMDSPDSEMAQAPAGMSGTKRRIMKGANAFLTATSLGGPVVYVVAVLAGWSEGAAGVAGIAVWIVGGFIWELVWEHKR